ncbi:hypothetical protein AAMO2058_001265100 [Amorphochlora amoebiformis]
MLKLQHSLVRRGWTSRKWQEGMSWRRFAALFTVVCAAHRWREAGFGGLGGGKRGRSSFYAVRGGKNGFSGVVVDWGACSELVKGVSNAEYKKFNLPQDAIQFALGNLRLANPTFQNNPENYIQVVNDAAETSSKENLVINLGEALEILQKASGGSPGDSKRRTGEREFSSKSSQAKVDKRIEADTEVQATLLDQTEALTVFTDGACESNGRDTALAGYGVYFHSSTGIESISRPLEGEIQTNQRAEMMAVISALDVLLALNQTQNDGASLVSPVLILSDSRYTVTGIKEWVPNWKKNNWQTSNRNPVKNKDLWVRLDKSLTNLRRLRPVELRWVKGHSGNPGNEKADQLAVRGIHMQRLTPLRR